MNYIIKKMRSDGAIFSPCREYRYALYREWDNTKPYVLFIGLNPSTADETVDDPTIRRCVNFSKSWGFGALVMANLFGFRSTKPKVMIRNEYPIGRQNDRMLMILADNAELVVCAWGQHGSHMGRGSEVVSLLSDKELFCLGTTKDGHPRHPLYIKSDKKPEPFKYLLGINNCRLAPNRSINHLAAKYFL